MELCGAVAEGDALLACNDPRRAADVQDYDRLIKKGDLCTNAQDYKALKNYALDLRQKLIECERDN